MFDRRAGFVVLAILLAGCMEGRKPTPLTRAGLKVTEIKVAAVPTGKVDEPKVEPAPKPEPKVEPPAKSSLYDRLGKEAAIAQVVDDLVSNVVADEQIKEKHKKHFMEGAVAALKKKLVDQIGEATGGPQKYIGKNMKDAHKGLEITDKDFDALLADLAKAMEKNKVAKGDQQELLKMLETMRKDVVEKAE